MSTSTLKDVKFKYCQVGSLNPGIGTFASTSVRATSLYDVDYTGTGTTPPRFAQYKLFYQKHMVKHAKCKVTFVYNSTTQPGNVVGIQLNEGSSAASDIPSFVCDPRSRHVIVSSIDGGQSVRAVTMEYDPCRFFGIKKGALGAYESINVATDANPSDNVFFTLHAAGLNTAADAPEVYYLLELEFTVDFKDPKLVVQA